MKPIYSFCATVFILSILITLTNSVSFTISSSSVLPDAARSTNSTYQIQLNAIGSFSTDFGVYISFPSAFSLTNVNTCEASLNGVNISTVACSRSSNVITFSSLNIAQTVQNIILKFNTDTALYSGSFTVTLQYFSPSNTAQILNTSSTLLTITNAAMVCSFASDSSLVGASTNYTLTYTPSSFVSASSILRVTFPAWSDYFLTNFRLVLLSNAFNVFDYRLN